MADVLAKYRAESRAEGIPPASIARPSRSTLNAAELANLDRRLLDYGMFTLEGLPPDQRAFLESLGALPGRTPAGWDEAMGLAPATAPMPAGDAEKVYAGFGDELVPAGGGPASRPFGDQFRDFIRSNLGAAGPPGDIRALGDQERFEAIAGELKRIEGMTGPKARIEKVKAIQSLDARYGADAVKKAITTLNQVGPAQATVEPPPPGATTVARSTPAPAPEPGPSSGMRPVQSASEISAAVDELMGPYKAAILEERAQTAGFKEMLEASARARVAAQAGLRPEPPLAPAASPGSPPISPPSPVASPVKPPVVRPRARKVAAAATSAAPPPVPTEVPVAPAPPAPNVPGPPPQVGAPSPPSAPPEFRPMDRPRAMAPASAAAPEFRTNAGDKVLSPAQMEARIAQASKVGAVGYTEAEQAAMEARASGRMASPTAAAAPPRANPGPARPSAPSGPFTLTGPRYDPLDALRTGLKNNTIPQTAGRAPASNPLETGEMAPLEDRLGREFGFKSRPPVPGETFTPAPSRLTVPGGTYTGGGSGQSATALGAGPTPSAAPGRAGPVARSVAGKPVLPFVGPPRPPIGPIANEALYTRPPVTGPEAVEALYATPTTPTAAKASPPIEGAKVMEALNPAASAASGAAAKPGLVRGAFGAAGRGIYNAAGYVPGGQPAIKGYGAISPVLPAAAILSDPYGTAEGIGAFEHNAARVLTDRDVNPLARQVGGFVGGIAAAPIQAIAGMARGDFNPAARMTLLPQVAGGAFKLLNGVGGVLNQGISQGWRPAAASALNQLAEHAGGLSKASQASFDRARDAYERANPDAAFRRPAGAGGYPPGYQPPGTGERQEAEALARTGATPAATPAATGTGDAFIPGLGRMTAEGARAFTNGTVTPYRRPWSEGGTPGGAPAATPAAPATPPAPPAPAGDLNSVLAKIAGQVTAPLVPAQSTASTFEIHPGFRTGRMTALDSAGGPMVPNGPVPDTLSPLIAAGAQADAGYNQAQLGQRRTLADFGIGAANAQANTLGAQAEMKKAENQEAIFKDKAKLKIYLIAQGMTPQAAEAAVNQGGPPPSVNQGTLGGLLSPGGSHYHMAGLLDPKQTPTPYHAAEFGLRTGADQDPYSFEVWREAMRRRFSDEEIQKALQPGMIERGMGESPGAKQARALLSRIAVAAQSR